MVDHLAGSDSLGVGCQQSREHLVSEQGTSDSSGSWKPAGDGAPHG